MNIIKSTKNSSSIIKSLNYSFRIIDKTNEQHAKKVVIYTLNTNDGSTPIEWQNFYFSPLYPIQYFNFVGSNIISGFLNGERLNPIIAVNGKSYSVSGNSFIESGTTIGGEFEVVNNDNVYNLIVNISRNGNRLETHTIAPEDNYSFGYRPTFYIGATNDLYTPLNLNEINTEISVLGITRADIELRKTFDVYSFVLTNISF